ncbi:MAG: DUF2288 family protein [Oscillatoriales cyanobacterium RM2_1_1]|nr:DUF2288 family protein [Oscillatoriales cyanobacterium SM2_3_0]NJO44982.1 DUF2288 family protein [Oscillatoriales cyanobacterium RM2_1_1]
MRDKLAESLDEAEWEWLIPHFQRDTLVVVDPSLDLLDVGVEIAQDNTLPVRHWLEEQLIHKPDVDEVTAWERDRTKRFNALIVQPFILVQEIPGAA